MAREKEIQIRRTAKSKVSVHLGQGAPDITHLHSLFQRLSPTVDVYFVVGNNYLWPLQSPKNGETPFKIFRYGTHAGSLALIRQIAADIHLETSPAHYSALKGQTTHMLLGSEAPEGAALHIADLRPINVVTMEKLEKVLATLI